MRIRKRVRPGAATVANSIRLPRSRQPPRPPQELSRILTRLGSRLSLATLINMTARHPFESGIVEAWDPATWRDLTVLVAVSGGADSVALLHGLLAVRQQLAGRLVVAHVNHHLRGVESDADEQFVRELCRGLELPCEIAHAEVPRLCKGDGLEAAAREQRYRLLSEVAGRRAARFVAVAHTADDQAETILHRVLRGTGLQGLAGIPFTRRLSEWSTIVRPLLGITRRQVLVYLQDRQQAFREDSSNQMATFTRNRLRHQLMPLLARDYNPQVMPALLRLGKLAREAQHVIDALVEPLWDRAVTPRDTHHVELSRDALREQAPFLVRALLVKVWTHQHWPRQQMNESKWTQLCELSQSRQYAPPPITLPGNIYVSANGPTLSLRRQGV